MRSKLVNRILSLLAILLFAPALQGQALTTLYSFTGGADGASPQAGVILDSFGSLYGTTPFGGNEGCNSSCGTVFEVDENGNERVLYSFNGGTDGANPLSQLIQGKGGNFFGTTLYGGGTGCGASGCGTIFEIDPDGNEVGIYAFSSNGLHDGGFPRSGLLLGPSSTAYGTTPSGGASDKGAVYAITKSNEQILYSFSGGQDGGYPDAALIKDKSGNFYGTTGLGGDTSCPVNPPLGCGTVFAVSPQGGEQVIYRFKGGSDGAVPFAALVRRGNWFFGTTIEGGGSKECAFGCGTIFRVDQAGHENVLHRFSGGADGASPYGSLLLNTDGSLYGTAANGGDTSCSAPFGCGTIFKIDSGGNFTVVHTFLGWPSDGALPLADLITDQRGTIYGTTSNGGAYDLGTVFKLTP